MPPLVVTLVAQRCKSAHAVLACEGFVAGVRSHVHFEVALLAEGLETARVLAVKLRFGRTRMFMVLVNPKSVLSRERFVAMHTQEFAGFLGYRFCYLCTKQILGNSMT